MEAFSIQLKVVQTWSQWIKWESYRSIWQAQLRPKKDFSPWIQQNVDKDENHYFCAHDNNRFLKYTLKVTLLKKRPLTFQDRVEKIDLVETRAQEWENTKWPFSPITNVACAPLQIITIECTDRALPDQLLKRRNVGFPHQIVLEGSTVIIFSSRGLFFCPAKYIFRFV